MLLRLHLLGFKMHVAFRGAKEVSREIAAHLEHDFLKLPDTPSLVLILLLFLVKKGLQLLDGQLLVDLGLVLDLFSAGSKAQRPQRLV